MKFENKIQTIRFYVQLMRKVTTNNQLESHRFRFRVRHGAAGKDHKASSIGKAYYGLLGRGIHGHLLQSIVQAIASSL